MRKNRCVFTYVVEGGVREACIDLPFVPDINDKVHIGTVKGYGYDIYLAVRDKICDIDEYWADEDDNYRMMIIWQLHCDVIENR